jgi:hypothetical protein
MLPFAWFCTQIKTIKTLICKTAQKIIKAEGWIGGIILTAEQFLQRQNLTNFPSNKIIRFISEKIVIEIIQIEQNWEQLNDI